MPDWFYRTVSRPLLYRLPARTARSFALGFMGGLARLPFGSTIIDLLGHMRADERLAIMQSGTRFPSPIGLGCGLDVEAIALPALARFGVGFIEIGPIALHDPPHAPRVERDDATQAIVFPDAHAPLGLATALPKLTEASTLGLPLIVRLVAEKLDELRLLITVVSPCATIIGVPAKLFEDVATEKIVPIVSNPSDLPLVTSARGAIVDGQRQRETGTEIGATARESALELVTQLRAQVADEFTIVAHGGVHEAADALALQAAGANLIAVDSGLVFTGPGLVKTINECVLAERVRTHPPPPAARPATRSWFWTMLMGAGMMFGSVLALLIAATRVVLPYDEQYVGMSCNQLRELNPRLISFMAHDRVTLAGTMVALGVLYVGLSWWAIRRGQHWAQVAVIASCITGFATFFFFLGFGYFDVFHAFVTAILFQFLLMAIYADLGPSEILHEPSLQTNRAWRMGLWGQLLLILHACAVMVAGLVIGGYGMTVVFVPEDLEYMGTTREVLQAANPKLLPLIAHDRATFGGMLICYGLVQLLTALWGLRANQSWLWWVLLVSALVGYTPAIAVHYAVGYTDLGHLVPAFGGLAACLTALGLLAPYMLRSSRPSG